MGPKGTGGLEDPDASAFADDSVLPSVVRNAPTIIEEGRAGTFPLSNEGGVLRGKGGNKTTAEHGGDKSARDQFGHGKMLRVGLSATPQGDGRPNGRLHGQDERTNVLQTKRRLPSTRDRKFVVAIHRGMVA